MTADFSAVTLTETGARSHRGATARAGARVPTQLKVSVGYLAGYVGEGEIGYAGTNARRARAARRARSCASASAAAFASCAST